MELRTRQFLVHLFRMDCMRIFWVPNSTILCIHEAIQMEMRFIREDDFFLENWHWLHFAPWFSGLSSWVRWILYAWRWRYFVKIRCVVLREIWSCGERCRMIAFGVSATFSFTAEPFYSDWYTKIYNLYSKIVIGVWFLKN